MRIRFTRFHFTLLSAVIWPICSAELAWWQKSVFYHIYPRSFQDSDSDGIGDLRGIIQRVDYLKDLGVNAIWMNPIFESPLKDFGYDISNYESIDKTYGTFEDFTALVNKLHENGMKILVDLVPNHSSNEHPWFKAALEGNSTYIDYYVWHDGKKNGSGNNTVPNNWWGVMGVSTWTWNEQRQKFYYHAFLPEQPDLNYRNPKVIEEMKNILRFWLNLGVDGFRVDAVPFLVEDDKFLDEPFVKCGSGQGYCLHNIYTQNRPETYLAMQELKSVLDDYNNPKYPGEKIIVVEATVDLKTLQNYYVYNKKRTSTMPFNFQLIYLNMNTRGVHIKQIVDSWNKHLIPEGWSNWVTGNHDQNRVGRKMGVPMTDGMNMLVLLLPGTSFTYYGEELGMDDTFVHCYQMQDIQGIRQSRNDCTVMETVSRDPERTPMQWDSSRYAGFSDHKPWLPVSPDHLEVNVESQKVDPRSHLNIYKALVKLKAEMQECMNITTAAPNEGWVFAFKRFGCKSSTHRYVILINFKNDYTTVKLSKEFSENELFVRTVSRSSDKKPGSRVSLNNLVLRPKESIVLATVSSSVSITPSITLLASSTLYYFCQLKY